MFHGWENRLVATKSGVRVRLNEGLDREALVRSWPPRSRAHIEYLRPNEGVSGVGVDRHALRLRHIGRLQPTSCDRFRLLHPEQAGSPIVSVKNKGLLDDGL